MKYTTDPPFKDKSAYKTFLNCVRGCHDMISDTTITCPNYYWVILAPRVDNIKNKMRQWTETRK